MAAKPKTEYPIHILRERLRRSSAQQAELLARSVNRLTSYDAQPCLEYRQEVESQYRLTDKLLYLQQCRSSLERCIASGSAHLRYRWSDGSVSSTHFRKVSPGRVQASGLLAIA